MLKRAKSSQGFKFTAAIKRQNLSRGFDLVAQDALCNCCADDVRAKASIATLVAQTNDGSRQNLCFGIGEA